MPIQLRSLLPKFHCVEGCYLIELDEGVPDSADVLQELERFEGSRERVEKVFNRCFVVLEALDQLGLDYKTFSEDDLLVVAEIFVSVIRDGLQKTFPAVPFNVEIVGSNLIDDEPLELYVTFSRSE